MLSTRWQPLVEMQSEVNRLRDEMDRVFGRWTHRRQSPSPSTPGVYPLLNVWEDDANLFVEAELPGVAMDALEMFVNGNQLTIQGARSEPSGDSGSWHRRERPYGKFARLFELPAFVDTDQVRAELKQGVLKITLPKRPESRPRRIEVQSE